MPPVPIAAPAADEEDDHAALMSTLMEMLRPSPVMRTA
jgi:hypothetical protein